MAIGVLIIIIAGILAALFPWLVNIVINKEIALQEGGRTYHWWKNPPVTPQMHVYIYNVTNADEFLNNGEKPTLQELGPYIYLETWEKVNIKFNLNDTVTYNVRKKFIFSEVIVYNV
jgi:scavenger receptor class B protein 1